MTDLPVLDLYSALDHKVGMDGTGSGGSGIDAAPAWSPTELDSRRLNAYFRLTALRENKGRILVREDENDPTRQAEWRELGDVAVIIDQQAGSVLGQDPGIDVVDADTTIADEPDWTDPPEPPVEGQGDEDPLAALKAEVYQVRLGSWEEQNRSIFGEWQHRVEQRPRLLSRQRWLRDWAERDRYIAKITELEHDAIVPLGDGVIVHGYDHQADLPTTEIFHPETYFPVLDDQSTNRFPSTVYLAWTFEEDDEAKLRVQTFELLPIDPDDPDYVDGIDIGDPLRYVNETTGERTHACVYSHRVYLADDVDSLYELDGVAPERWEQHEVRRGEYVDADRVPWHTDFLPVVHIPNTLATLEHFGRSPILRVVQAADEVANNDRLEGLAAHYAGRPITGLDGGASARQTSIDLSPGQTLSGKVSVIDMAGHLQGLAERGERLRSTLFTNSFTSEGMIGRISPDEVPSGLALSLSFTSFEQHIERMRMVRAMKYALSLKMVQRLAIQHQSASLVGDGAEEDMVALPARIRFGTFMPQDLAGASKVLQLLAQAEAVSIETRVQMAVEAGAPITDVDAEVARIYGLMTTRADQMTAALEDPRYAREFLRLEEIDDPVDDGVDADNGDVVTPPDALLGQAVGAGSTTP